MFTLLILLTTCLSAGVLGGVIPDDDARLAPPLHNANETSLTAEDFAAAANLSNDEDVNDDDIPKRWDMTEGDFIDHSHPDDEKNGNETRRKRGSNAIRNSNQLWPGGRVPYTISTIFSSAERSKIAQGMQELMQRTCLNFVARQSSDREYLQIRDDGDGCYTINLGRVPGRTTIVSLERGSRGGGCLFKGVVVHELLHAVGFYHEHSRSDRDDWLQVNLQNVRSGLHSQFSKYRPTQEADLGTQYDYGSVMHYGTHAGSKNNQPVLVPKKPVPAGVRIGQRSNLSPVDAQEVNLLYNCAVTGGGNGGGTTAKPFFTLRPPTTRAPVVTPQPATGDCVDLLGARQCTIYKNANICQKYDFIIRQCRRTCSLCGASVSTNADCADRRDTNYCNLFRTFCASTPSFAAGCPRTCLACDRDLCRDHATSAQCSGINCNSLFARRNCLVSCKYC